MWHSEETPQHQQVKLPIWQQTFRAARGTELMKAKRAPAVIEVLHAKACQCERMRVSDNRLGSVRHPIPAM
jgi:hypothetical protein